MAVKYKMHLETVIGYRQKYLQETERKEMDQNFLRYQSEVIIMYLKLFLRVEDVVSIKLPKILHGFQKILDQFQINIMITGPLS